MHHTVPLAFVACFIDSTVWGLTPSSAATTSMTTSVTKAPLALIVSNAACPGVSINVMVFSPPGTGTVCEKKATMHKPKGPIVIIGSNVI